MNLLKSLAFLCLAVVGTAGPGTIMAQDAVVAAPDVDALFTDGNRKLHRNKQVVYHIMKDLLEAGRWDEAHRYLTERYVQHNPNVASGRQAVVDFFKGLGMKPVPARLSAPVVQVIAQGDYVMVASVATLPHPAEAGKTYTTTWFDLFRMKDGKADEHWDSATIMAIPGK